jgi:hypothetical protein
MPNGCALRGTRVRRRSVRRSRVEQAVQWFCDAHPAAEPFDSIGAGRTSTVTCTDPTCSWLTRLHRASRQRAAS